MGARQFFLGLFVFSLALFAFSLFIGFQSGYTIALHLALVSIALTYLYQKGIKEFLEEVGFPGPIKDNAVYTALGLVSIAVLLTIISAVFNFLGINDQKNILDIVKDLPVYLLVFAVVFAPVSEELFFRAFLSRRTGIIISSAVFALFHYSYGSVIQIAGAFAIGALLAYIYKKSGSITPAILIHMIYNAASVVIMRFLI